MVHSTSLAIGSGFEHCLGIKRRVKGFNSHLCNCLLTVKLCKLCVKNKQVQSYKNSCVKITASICNKYNRIELQTCLFIHHSDLLSFEFPNDLEDHVFSSCFTHTPDTSSPQMNILFTVQAFHQTIWGSTSLPIWNP